MQTTGEESDAQTLRKLLASRLASDQIIVESKQHSLVQSA